MYNKLKKEKLNNSYGIILVALVVTIVVMLIIAGVSIDILVGNNGLINKANESKENYNVGEIKEKISLLLNEYAIEDTVNENMAFDKFLRKNLKVSVSKNEDDTYLLILGEYKVNITKNKIISIEKFNLNAEKEFPSVEAMKTAPNLINGQLIKTEGYYDKKYGGSAYYDIVDTTELSVDNCTCISLNNGLYAVIHPINDTVTVNQFGAYGDGVHDDSAEINKAINSNFSNISFENMQYKINSKIDIKANNKFIIGNDSIIFYDNDFSFTNDYIVKIYNDNNQITNNVDIDGLKIINKNSIQTKEHTMLKIANAENVDITSCKLEAGADENNKKRPVTNIIVSEHWKNINIDSCDLINTTLASSGGSIRIEAGKDKNENLNFTNNKIQKNSCAETIKILGEGIVNNVKFLNNTINFDGTNSQNKASSVIFLGLQTTQIENIEFSENDITAVTPGSFMKFDKVNGLLIKNNTLKLNSLANEGAIGYVSGTSNSYNTKFESNKVELIGNSIETEAFSNISSIINNEINVKTPFSLFIQKCDELSGNTITFNNEFNRYNSIFIIRQTSLTGDVNISDNKFIFNTNITEESRLINLYYSYLNDFKVTISNNEVIANKDQITTAQYAVYFQGMKDKTPKKVYMKNNSLGFYSGNIGKYENLSEYTIVEE